MKHLPLIVVIACIAAVIYNSLPTLAPGGGDDKSPTNAINPPPLSLQPSLEPLKRLRETSPALCRDLSHLYVQMANAVQKNTSLSNLAQFSAAHTAILKEFLVQYDQQPAGIGGDIDRVLMTHLGGDNEIQNLPIDASTRPKLVEALLAIAWAFGG